MQVYMTVIQGVDASSAPTQVEVEQMAQGDLVLGIVTFTAADKKSIFASSVTAGTGGITNALVQNSQNLFGVNMIALMQRGTSVSFSGSATIDLQT